MSDFDKNIKEAKLDVELENIVDYCIEEEKEKLKAQEERYKNVEEFSKYKSMNKDHDLHSKFNQLHSEILINRSASMKSEGKILEVAADNNKLIKSVDTKFNKVIYALFVIFFLLGVFVGILDEVWKPYITDILNFTRASTNIMKG